MAPRTMVKCDDCGKYSVPGPANCEYCGASLRGAARVEVDESEKGSPTGIASTPPATFVPVTSNRVVVTDFDMPFGSMVMFMVKWAFASIPAMLVLGIVAGILIAMFGALIGLGSLVRP